MTKQEQIEETANISTKEEIEARNRRGKEKDELSQALLHYATVEASGGIKSLIDCEGCAFYLYENLGYRKLPEDSVVLSSEEYEQLKRLKTENNRLYDIKFDLENQLIEKGWLDYEGADKIEERVRKETAEKFMVLRRYITKQFHKYHEARDRAESAYKKCKEEMCKAILNNDWHRYDAIMFILEDMAMQFDELAKQFGLEIEE